MLSQQHSKETRVEEDKGDDSVFSPKTWGSTKAVQITDLELFGCAFPPGWQRRDLLQQHGRNHGEKIPRLILRSAEVVERVFEQAANTSNKTPRAVLFWDNSAETKYVFPASPFLFFPCQAFSPQIGSGAARLEPSASSRGLFALRTVVSQLGISYHKCPNFF